MVAEKIRGHMIGALVTLCAAVTLCADEPLNSPKPSSQPTHDQYMNRVLSLKPVGYWPLHEASGAVARDATPHHRNGMYQNQVRLHEIGPMGGGFAAGFDAKNKSFVEIASNKDFSQPTNDGLTIEVWMRPCTLTFKGETREPYIHWLGKGENGHMEWGFRFYSRETYRPNWTSAYIWSHSGGEGAGAHTTIAPAAGEWRHIVATYDRGGKANPRAGVTLYVNGVRQQGPPVKGTLYQSYEIEPEAGPAPVRVGTRDLKSFFTGALSDVAIYSRVLTETEVKENYRIATAGRAVAAPSVPKARQ